MFYVITNIFLITNDFQIIEWGYWLLFPNYVLENMKPVGYVYDGDSLRKCCMHDAGHQVAVSCMEMNKRSWEQCFTY